MQAGIKIQQQSNNEVTAILEYFNDLLTVLLEYINLYYTSWLGFTDKGQFETLN